MAAAAAVIGGALIEGFGQGQTNASNRREAERNRNFQREMSSTAVYRRMQDLKRSGINPILAGKFDASTPAGNMATMGNIGGAAMSGATSAANIQKTRGDTKTGLTTKATQIAELDMISKQRALILEQITTASNVAQQSALQLKLDMQLKRLDAEIYSGTEGKILRRMQLYQSPVNSAINFQRNNR